MKLTVAKNFTLVRQLTKKRLPPKPGQRVGAEKNLRALARRMKTGVEPHAHFQIILDLLELGADFPALLRFAAGGMDGLSPEPVIFCLESRPIAFRPKKTRIRRNAGRTPLSAGAKNLRHLYGRTLKIVRG